MLIRGSLLREMEENTGKATQNTQEKPHRLTVLNNPYVDYILPSNLFVKGQKINFKIFLLFFFPSALGHLLKAEAIFFLTETLIKQINVNARLFITCACFKSWLGLSIVHFLCGPSPEVANPRRWNLPSLCHGVTEHGIRSLRGPPVSPRLAIPGKSYLGM